MKYFKENVLLLYKNYRCNITQSLSLAPRSVQQSLVSPVVWVERWRTAKFFPPVFFSFIAGHAVPLSTTQVSPSNRPMQVGTDSTNEVVLLYLTARTHTVHRCSYECHQRSQFTEHNAEPCFLSGNISILPAAPTSSNRRKPRAPNVQMKCTK